MNIFPKSALQEKLVSVGVFVVILIGIFPLWMERHPELVSGSI